MDPLKSKNRLNLLKKNDFFFKTAAANVVENLKL